MKRGVWGDSSQPEEQVVEYVNDLEAYFKQVGKAKSLKGVVE